MAGGGRYRLDVLLAAGCLAAGGALYAEVTRLPFAPATTLSAAVVPSLPAPAPSWAMPPAAAFAPIVARPLFSEGRRPPPEVTPAAAAAVELRALSLAVTAIILAPDRRLAVVETAPGKAQTQTLSIGDAIDGWQLVEIAAEHLVFEGDGQRRRLALKDLPGAESASPAAVAAASPPPEPTQNALATTVIIDGRQVEILPEHQGERGEGSILAAVPVTESQLNNP